MNRAQDSNTQKISRQFTSRLNSLNPSQRIRAIVLLRSDQADGVPTRQSVRRRQARIRAIRKSAGPALTQIDSILEKHDGHRLAQRPNALGAIPVETTPAGINALVASEHVKAVLEDQAVFAV